MHAPSKLPSLAVAALLAALSCGVRAETWLENPVDFSYPYDDGTGERRISELRDPAVIKVGDTWYLTHTHFPFTHSDSRDATKPDFNSSPGIPLWSSKDLKQWKFEKWLVKSSELPDDCPYKHRFWAPEIHRIGGKFHLVFTADNWLKDEPNKGGKIGAYVAFVGVADHVTGPYEKIRWLEGAGCDTTLFEDTDGKTYAIMPFGDQFIQEVDLEQMKLVGDRTRIVSRDNTDVGTQTSPDYLEGPWMIQRNGKYILFTAAPYKKKVGELEIGYWTGAAVADRVLGPYQKLPQVFPGGHVSVFDGPDGDAWLSYRGEAGGIAAGRLNLQPIPFASDGSVKPFHPELRVPSR
ncbi:MAG: family 43 glycosylhydrolase [Verrucomicrobiota bacterium]